MQFEGTAPLERGAGRLTLPQLGRLGSVLRLVLFYAALIGLWQLVHDLHIWSPYLLPAPEQAFRAVRRYAENGVLWKSIRTTMQNMLVGFSIAFVLGMVLGIAIASWRWLDETLGSLVVGMQSLPSVTWLPLAILWFGLSTKAIVFVVIMGSVWAIATSARDGVRNIPPLQRRAAQVFGASRSQTILHVTLPGMLPSMAQGLKLGWSFSWRSLMAAELLGVGQGVGRLLELGRDLNNMGLVIGMMIVIVLIGLTFDRLVFNPLEAWVRQRWGLAGA
jgi:NitT/TauT family transport system permease protein